MPAQISELDIMDEDQLIEEVLDKFVNCHEQTYEEFLSTFTHLSKEDNVTKRGAFGTDSSENIFPSIKFARGNEPNDHHLRNKAIFLRASSQCSEEEQVVIDEGQKVGISFQGDLTWAGKVKVDNFLDLEDLEEDEETQPQMSKDLLLLPGEVEEDIFTCVPSYVPSVAQPFAPAVKPGPSVRGADRQTEEILGDEVQPFSLDEEFDYDAVMLTPKFTPAEIDAITELSQQTREIANPDLEEPHG
ncbi:intraflagellar transport-associated protein isoform X1 [Ursus maritimus]|uniref:Intraflagellar transport associated protein n=1 Tax=Ursus maritimus TaxID=29073 RepID=A0A384BRY7_URSMA|nr:intraflagellar transport-associated protein isoform X1 [Ursus maritimus]XP_008685009.1 intraflagellar transport-associated protein isoform X1 [Ursus maritimus]XP_040494901.1 intraflagellar transport-associated protein isoform X1 [Ursus maritimus]XP_044244946.1 intraflagellar transport-associated protein isoform X1 [Ursus arctos]XP_044244948.1 intraflagellar transport-associated protein isoform X1 [Ursus arctos]XP_044244949.1 intraflagellar transport-associated protein isoform X1 [Ursus arct